MDSKQKRDEALNLADFKIDDISSVPGDQLLTEVAEDFGHPAFLAAEFDSIAFPVMSRHDNGAVNQGNAAATLSMRPAALSAASRLALRRPLPATPWSFPRTALAMLAEWLAVPLRRRLFLGAFAALLLVAALTPGIYPLLVNRPADRIATASKNDPSTRLPASTLSQPPPAMNPASPESAAQSPAVTPIPASAPRTPPPTEQKQLRAVTAGADQAGEVARDRQGPPPPALAASRVAPAPQSMAAAQPPAASPAGAQALIQRHAAAKSHLTEGGGFFVQLSASKSEAEAQSTFQALKSKYAVLKGREPVIRRKDEDKRNVFYAVQVGPFELQDDADQLCKQLKTAGGICFVTRN
jgi:hypothetical protein